MISPIPCTPITTSTPHWNRAEAIPCAGARMCRSVPVQEQCEPLTLTAAKITSWVWGTAGTLALHSGGVTYGPYASDTFALVEAKGASGARINNAQGARIDVFGYGIAPSLAPYRYNTISIDGTDRDVELEGGNVRVVPVRGAVPKVAFNTLGGTPALIAVMMPDGSPVPMGAEVQDRDGKTLGWPARMDRSMRAARCLRHFIHSLGQQANVPRQLPDARTE